MSRMEDLEARRIIEAAAMARPAQPQPQGIDPALAFFVPSFYQFITADVSAFGLIGGVIGTTPPEARVDAAWELSVTAFRKLGFDYVPKLRWKEAATESNGRQ